MSKFNIKNSQIGIAGDGATNNTFVFNGKTDSINDELDMLKKEINLLKNYISTKSNMTEEECELLKITDEIETCIDEKDLNSTYNKIKKYASKLFHSFAFDVGAGLLTDYLSNLLKL